MWPAVPLPYHFLTLFFCLLADIFLTSLGVTNPVLTSSLLLSHAFLGRDLFGQELESIGSKTFAGLTYLEVLCVSFSLDPSPPPFFAGVS